MTAVTLGGNTSSIQPPIRISRIRSITSKIWNVVKKIFHFFTFGIFNKSRPLTAKQIADLSELGKRKYNQARAQFLKTHKIKALEGAERSSASSEKSKEPLLYSEKKFHKSLEDTQTLLKDAVPTACDFLQENKILIPIPPIAKNKIKLIEPLFTELQKRTVKSITEEMQNSCYLDTSYSPAKSIQWLITGLDTEKIAEILAEVKDEKMNPEIKNKAIEWITEHQKPEYSKNLKDTFPGMDEEVVLYCCNAFVAALVEYKIRDLKTRISKDILTGAPDLLIDFIRKNSDKVIGEFTGRFSEIVQNINIADTFQKWLNILLEFQEKYVTAEKEALTHIQGNIDRKDPETKGRLEDLTKVCFITLDTIHKNTKENFIHPDNIKNEDAYAKLQQKKHTDLFIEEVYKIICTIQIKTGDELSEINLIDHLQNLLELPDNVNNLLKELHEFGEYSLPNENLSALPKGEESVSDLISGILNDKIKTSILEITKNQIKEVISEKLHDFIQTLYSEEGMKSVIGFFLPQVNKLLLKMQVYNIVIEKADVIKDLLVRKKGPDYLKEYIYGIAKVSLKTHYDFDKLGITLSSLSEFMLNGLVEILMHEDMNLTHTPFKVVLEAALLSKDVQSPIKNLDKAFLSIFEACEFKTGFIVNTALHSDSVKKKINMDFGKIIQPILNTEGFGYIDLLYNFLNHKIDTTEKIGGLLSQVLSKEGKIKTDKPDFDKEINKIASMVYSILVTPNKGFVVNTVVIKSVKSFLGPDSKRLEEAIKTVFSKYLYKKEFTAELVYRMQDLFLQTIKGVPPLEIIPMPEELPPEVIAQV